MPKIVKKDELNKKLLQELLPKIHSGDIFQLNTYQLAQILGISKATLYKVYPDKTAIYSSFIDGMIEFIQQGTLADVPQEANQYLQKFNILLDKFISSELLLSPKFLSNLKHSYPDLFLKITVVLENQDQQILHFYTQMIDLGIFRPTNPKFMLIQQRALLQYMIYPPKFIQSELTVRNFIDDYYSTQVALLFTDTPESNNGSVALKDHLIKKIERVLTRV